MIIKEGKAILYEYDFDKISKKNVVFYNPNRKCERDFNIEINNVLFKENYSCLDLLAASGVRGIRLYLETKCNFVAFNDISKDAINLIKKNVELNRIDNYKIYNYDGRALPFMIDYKFNYIDIDPFGSPINFLNPITNILNRKSILAITYTDVGVLLGKYKDKAKIRYFLDVEKYNHEYGIRNGILIAIREMIRESYLPIPIFSFHEKHYYRIYFKVIKVGFGKIKKFLDNNLGFIYDPIKNKKYFTFIGKLWDNDLINNIKFEKKECIFKKYLEILKEEIKIDIPYYYELHDIAKKYKIKKLKKINELIDEIKNLGYKASRTIFSPTGIRSNINFNELIKLLT